MIRLSSSPKRPSSPACGLSDGDGDPRAGGRRSGAASPGRPGGSWPRRPPSVSRSKTRRSATCSVTWTTPRPERLAGAARSAGAEVEHHRVVGHAAALGEDLGVAGVRDAAGAERLLVQRQGRDRVDPPGQGQVDRRRPGSRTPPGRPGRRPGPRATLEQRLAGRSRARGRGRARRDGLGLLGPVDRPGPWPRLPTQVERPAQDVRLADHERAGRGRAARDPPRPGRSPRGRRRPRRPSSGPPRGRRIRASRSVVVHGLRRRPAVVASACGDEPVASRVLSAAPALSSGTAIPVELKSSSGRLFRQSAGR